MLLCPLSVDSAEVSVWQDNFETNDLLGWQVLNETDATFATSSTQKYSGSYSGRLNITADAGTGYIVTALRTSGYSTFYLRSRIYMTSAMATSMATNGDYVALLMVANQSGSTIVVELRFGQDAGLGGYIIALYNGLAGQDVYKSGITWSAWDDTWHTVEVKVVVSATVGEVYLWVDGVLEDSGTSLNTGTATAGRLYIGSSSTSGVTDDAYFDDIVFDTSRQVGLGWRIKEDSAIGGGYHY